MNQEKIVNVPLREIDFSLLGKRNPRAFDEEHAWALTRSINEAGVKTPFIVFKTDEGYRGATGWHRQWGLRKSHAELIAQGIQPNRCPMDAVPCEVREGDFYAFWECLFKDNTQFHPGLNPLMGKNPRRNEFRAMVEHLLLLPRYLEMSNPWLGEMFGITAQTADRWRAGVIQGIADNAYGLTEEHRAELLAVLDSGVRVGRDGIRQVSKQQKPDTPADASDEPSVDESLSSETEEAMEEVARHQALAAASAAMLSLMGAFEAQSSLSALMDFETFSDTAAPIIKWPRMMFQSLLIHAQHPEAETTEVTQMARDFTIGTSEMAVEELSQLTADVNQGAEWITALLAECHEKELTRCQNAYTALQSIFASEFPHYAEPDLPVEVLLLPSTYFRKLKGYLGAAGVRLDKQRDNTPVFMVPADWDTVQIQQVVQRFDTHQALLEAGNQNDVLTALALEARVGIRRKEVLYQFGIVAADKEVMMPMIDSLVAESLKMALQHQIDAPPTANAELVLPESENAAGTNLLSLQQWHKRVDAGVIEEQRARRAAYEVAYRRVESEFYRDARGPALFLEANPPASDSEQDAMPQLSFAAFMSRVAGIASEFDEDVFSDIPSKMEREDTPAFWLQLQRSVSHWEQVATYLAEPDALPDELMPVKQLVQLALKREPNEMGFRRELQKRFKNGQATDTASMSQNDWVGYRDTYQLTFAELHALADAFTLEVVTPAKEKARALQEHERAFDGVMSSFSSVFPDEDFGSMWDKVMPHAEEAGIAVEPNYVAVDRRPEALSTSEIRRKTHGLHEVAKAIKHKVSWLSHLLPKPAEPVAPGEPAETLSFEELCARVSEDLAVLVAEHEEALQDAHIRVDTLERIGEALANLVRL